MIFLIMFSIVGTLSGFIFLQLLDNKITEVLRELLFFGGISFLAWIAFVWTYHQII